jgi:hypothetical protein
MGPSEKEWIFKKWIKAAVIRALKTVAQTAIATIGVSAVMSDVNWLAVGSSAVLAGILSILTSVAGLPEVPDHYDGPDYREG